MGTGPIEAQATQAVNNSGPINLTVSETGQPVPDSVINTEQPHATSIPEMTPAEELIKAMHLFIEAQTDYIHTPDLGRMASAQEAYITAQTRYIARNLTK